MATLARRSQRIQSSAVREILAVLDRPDMISFAGGLPAADTFPALTMPEGKDLLQYGASEGDWQLRKAIGQYLETRQLFVDPSQIIVLSGSQQGIDLVAKLFIDDGTRIAIESPTYLAALQVFYLFGAECLAFDLANDLSDLPDPSATLCYSQPNFKNPTGEVYSSDARKRLANHCLDADICLFEDDPYGELRYEDCITTPVCSLMDSGSWLYQSSFSKTHCPGLRLGYLVCSDDLLPQLKQLKQAADLHSNRLSQALLLQQLNSRSATQRLTKLRTFYRQKRDRFQQLLEKHLHQHATWQIPKGGLFFWLTLRQTPDVDTRRLLQRGIGSGIAFMPGEPFFPDSKPPAPCLRLNFSFVPEQQIETGLIRLGALLSAS